MDAPAMNFLMIDGEGDPNTSKDYSDAVEALFSLAYPIKFMSRKTLGRDYGVLPLEGLWSASDPTAFAKADKSKYQWTMMIMQPEWITQTTVSQALDSSRAKKELVGLSKVRFERCYEGPSLQALHVGSYDDEAPNFGSFMSNTCRRTI